MKASELTIEQTEGLIREQVGIALADFLPKLLAALPTGPGTPQKAYNVDETGQKHSFIGGIDQYQEPGKVVPTPQPPAPKNWTTVMEIYTLEGPARQAMLDRIGMTDADMLRLKAEGKEYEPIYFK